MENPLRKQNRYGRLYLRYAVSALIVLLFTMAAVAWGHRRTEENLIDEKIRETCLLLTQLSRSVNDDLLRVRSRVADLAVEPEIRQITMLQTYPGPKQAVPLIDAQRRINQYALTGAFTCEAAMLFPHVDNLMLTTHQIITNLQIHYEFGLLACRDLTYQAFLSELTEPGSPSGSRCLYYPEQPVSFYDNGQRNIILCRMEPHTGGQGSRLIALLFVDADSIYQRLASLLPKSGGWIRITDGAGQILLDRGDPDSIGEIPALLPSDPIMDSSNGVVVTALAENDLELSISLFLPDNWVRGQIRPITLTLQLFFAAALVLGTAVSIFTVFQNGKPWARIEQKLDESFGGNGGGSVRHIERRLDRLCNNTLEMQTRLKNWQPILETGILERLYKGGIVVDRELAAVPWLREHLPPKFAAGVLRWKPYPDQPPPAENPMAAVTQGMSQILDGAFLHPLGPSRVAFLVDMQAHPAPNASDLLCYLVSEFSETSGLLFAAGLGLPCERIDELHRSCSEANYALMGIRDWHTNRVACYSPTGRKSTGYDFSYDCMDRLTSYMVNGNTASMKSLLEQIYNRNFIARIFPEEDIFRFYNDLWEVLNHCIDQIPIDEILEKIPPCSQLATAVAVYERFCAAFEDAAALSHSQKDRVMSRLMDAILEFIEEEYKNPAISLSLLAEQFGMSEKYISTFFKAYTGVKFSDYVEEKRMAQAAALMAQTKKSIQEIQAMVGYAGGNTFYKAFRRKYGVSPSVWREQQRLGQFQSKTESS